MRETLLTSKTWASGRNGSFERTTHERRLLYRFLKLLVVVPNFNWFIVVPSGVSRDVGVRLEEALEEPRVKHVVGCVV